MFTGKNIDQELEESLRGGVWAKLCGSVRLWFLTRFEEVIGGLYTRRYKVHAAATDAKTNLAQAQIRFQETVGHGQIALEEQKSRLQNTVSQGQIVLAEQKVHLQHLLSAQTSGQAPRQLAPQKNPVPSSEPTVTYGYNRASSKPPPVMVDISDEKIEEVALTTVLRLGPARDSEAERKFFVTLNDLYKQYPAYVAKEIAARAMQVWENSRP